MGENRTSSETSPEEQLAPGKEPRETFLTALNILRELMKTDAVTFRVGRFGKAEIALDDDAFAQVSEEQFSADLPRRFFRVLLGTELESLLNAAVEDSEDGGIRVHFPPKVVKEVGQDEIKWRLSQVRQTVLPGDLKDRVRLRRTARGPVWEDLTWQVCLKERDEAEGPMGGIPFAVLSVSYSEALAGEPALVIGEKGTTVSLPISTATTRMLTMELHQADIEYMIDKLTVIRDTLAGIRRRS